MSHDSQPTFEIEVPEHDVTNQGLVDLYHHLQARADQTPNLEIADLTIHPSHGLELP